VNEELIQQRFVALISQSDEKIPLDEVALTIACVAYPKLRIRDYLDRIDRLADSVAERVGNDTASLQMLVLMQKVLFEEQGLRGNRDDYYDPRNSYLNDVMDRHLGIPISLAVIYLAVADRLGLPVSGVSFPGHFLLRWQLPEGQVIVDVFNGGATLGTDDISKLAESAFGRSLSDPTLATRLLVPCLRRQIIARMLRNLEVIKGNDEQDPNARQSRLAFLNLCLLAEPDSKMQLSNRASVLTELDCYSAAISDLERLHELSVQAGEAVEEIEQRLQILRIETPSVH